MLSRRLLWTLLLLFPATACSRGAVAEGAAMSPVPLTKECVGRIQIDLPRSATPNWTQKFDWSEVKRLPRSIATVGDFWSHVEARKGALAASSHKIESSRLSDFRKVSDHSAVLLYRASSFDQAGYDMERYLWLGSTGYQLKTKAIPDADKDRLDPYYRIFGNIKERKNFNVPTGSGFCIDGASVEPVERERISATLSLEVPTWKRVHLWVGALEDGNGVQRQSIDEELEMKLAAVRQMASGARVSAEPGLPKNIEVLRHNDRHSGGIPGREAAWRIDLQRGGVIYAFRWETGGAGLGTAKNPALAVGLDVDTSDEPGATLPEQSELLALWDAVLGSLRPR